MSERFENIIKSILDQPTNRNPDEQIFLQVMDRLSNEEKKRKGWLVFPWWWTLVGSGLLLLGVYFFSTGRPEKSSQKNIAQTMVTVTDTNYITKTIVVYDTIYKKVYKKVYQSEYRFFSDLRDRVTSTSEANRFGTYYDSVIKGIGDRDATTYDNTHNENDHRLMEDMTHSKESNMERREDIPSHLVRPFSIASLGEGINVESLYRWRKTRLHWAMARLINNKVKNHGNTGLIAVKTKSFLHKLLPRHPKISFYAGNQSNLNIGSNVYIDLGGMVEFKTSSPVSWLLGVEYLSGGFAKDFEDEKLHFAEDFPRISPRNEEDYLYEIYGDFRYLMIPFGLKYEFLSGRINPYLSAGVKALSTLTSNLEYEYIGGELYVIEKNGLKSKKFELDDYWISIGGSYYLSPQWDFFGEISYQGNISEGTYIYDRRRFLFFRLGGSYRF